MNLSGTYKLYETLQSQGYRMTGQRRLILDAVVARKGRFTANDVLSGIQETAPYIGRATVFRALDLLARLGLLNKVHESGGCHGYVLCENSHHHHLICSQCGTVVEIPDCHLSDQARELSKATSFRIDGHYLEYYGLCGACQVRRN